MNTDPSPTPEPVPESTPESVPDPGPAAITELDTLTFRRSCFYVALMPVAFVLGLAAGYLIWGRAMPVPTSAASPTESSAAPQASAQTAKEITRYPVPVDDDPTLGPDDAPVTIIEFSDFECPYCRRFHAETFPRLLEAYPGQVRYVYRDFPLDNIHANARSAAVAANCADEQGKFWSFHDLLFSAPTLSPAVYQSIAGSLNLDMSAFAECQQSERAATEVNADFEYAAGIGIRSTPTFFINGIAVVGAQPFEVFKQIIDMELGSN